MPRAKGTRPPADDPGEGPRPGGTEATVVTVATPTYDAAELVVEEWIRDVPPEDEDDAPEDDD